MNGDQKINYANSTKACDLLDNRIIIRVKWIFARFQRTRKPCEVSHLVIQWIGRLDLVYHYAEGVMQMVLVVYITRSITTTSSCGLTLTNSWLKASSEPRIRTRLKMIWGTVNSLAITFNVGPNIFLFRLRQVLWALLYWTALKYLAQMNV